MDDDKAGGATDDTSPLPSRGKRKRPGPTIELTATDVSEASVAQSKTSTDQTSTNEASADKVSANETSNGEMPPEGTKEFSAPSSRWPSFSTGVGSLLLAVLTSAAVAALVAGGILLTGRSEAPVVTSAASPDRALIDALRTRIAALETQSQQSAPAPAADPAMASKIAAIETSLASLRSDIGQLRAQADGTAASIDALKSARQEQVAAGDVATLEERLTKLERATIALTADVPAHPAPAAPVDPTVPRVAAAALLDQAVHRAEPYEAALNNARKFGDTGALKALEPFAATGVPTAASLSRDLLALLPQLAPKPDEPPVPSGILQRLQDSAMKLVRVRRIGDAQSDDLLSRIKDTAQREDIAEAKRLILTLPDSQRTLVQPWIDRTDARDAALAAASRYAQDAMSVLPRPIDSQR